MGITKYWNAPHILNSLEDASNIAGAVDKAFSDSASGEKAPRTVLVDCGSMYRHWARAVQAAWREADLTQVANGDFVGKVHTVASNVFHTTVMREMRAIAAEVDLVVACWDNPNKSPTAKEQEKQLRGQKVNESRCHFLKVSRAYMQIFTY